MGDAVLLRDDEDREVVGICEGAQVLVATDRGVIPFPMARALCAWRVD
jgi:phosphoribosylformylglycinamidine (FGAM) synthase-like amidotransferase family enzyme